MHGNVLHESNMPSYVSLKIILIKLIKLKKQGFF